MICAFCNTANHPDNVYCNSCGNPVAGNVTFSAQPTQPYHQQVPPPTIPAANQQYSSVITPFVGQSVTPPKKRNAAGVLISVTALLVVGAAAVAGLIIATNYGGTNETLPSHLGMFLQSDAKDRVDEIRREDFTNASEARNALMKNELPSSTSLPNLILYADSRDIPVNDIRLIQLDTMKDDGSMKTLDFQVAPVDGKPEMKRIRVPAAIASGRYAFALFDGYFNEGKHKFWPFQVRDSSKSDNGPALKAASVSLKPKSPAAPAAPAAARTVANVSPSAPPPSGGTAATVKTRIKLRSGPTQFANNQIGSLKPGMRVYILDYSTSVETYQGITSRYAYVQTESGLRGWVFAAYLQ